VGGCAPPHLFFFVLWLGGPPPPQPTRNNGFSGRRSLPEPLVKDFDIALSIGQGDCKVHCSYGRFGATAVLVALIVAASGAEGTAGRGAGARRIEPVCADRGCDYIAGWRSNICGKPAFVASWLALALNVVVMTLGTSMIVR
jgi:hypothetical protein